MVLGLTTHNLTASVYSHYSHWLVFVGEGSCFHPKKISFKSSQSPLYYLPASKSLRLVMVHNYPQEPEDTKTRLKRRAEYCYYAASNWPTIILLHVQMSVIQLFAPYRPHHLHDLPPNSFRAHLLQEVKCWTRRNRTDGWDLCKWQCGRIRRVDCGLERI